MEVSQHYSQFCIILAEWNTKICHTCFDCVAFLRPILSPPPKNFVHFILLESEIHSTLKIQIGIALAFSSFSVE